MTCRELPWGVVALFIQLETMGTGLVHCVMCLLMPKLLLMVIMVALCNRADHYIFMLWFVLSSSSFFSSPNLSGRRLDVYHTSTHGVVLVRI